MILLRAVLISAVYLVVCASSGEAAFGIVESSGVTVIEELPDSLLPGDYRTSRPIIAREASSIEIPSEVPIDHDGSPVFTPAIWLSWDGLGPSPVLRPGNLPAGQVVDSYLFHFDSGASPFYSSTIEFASPIIGVQLFGETLEFGDPDSETDYPTNTLRGVEGTIISVYSDGKTISLTGSAFGSDIDQVRIYTLATPELTTIAGWSIFTILGAVILYWRGIA